MLWVLVDAASHKGSKHIYVLNHLGKTIVTGNRSVGMTNTGELMWSSYSSHDLSKKKLFTFSSTIWRGNTFTRVNIEGLEEFRHHSVRTIHTFIDYVGLFFLISINVILLSIRFLFKHQTLIVIYSS